MIDTDFEQQNERQMKDEEKNSKALLSGTLMLGSQKTGISVPVLPLMDQETNNRTEAFERKRSGMSNEELIRLCESELSRLCKTYGQSFAMSIPPRVADTDMLFSELIRRFKENKKK